MPKTSILNHYVKIEQNQEHLVTIIINNYNYGSFLKDAIESVIHQTYKNIEIIVVDDGSTDNSAEIVQEYAGENLVIPIIKKNGGQISACNAGYKESHGDIILFLDSDDVLLEDAVETVVKVWNISNACIQTQLLICDTNLYPLGGVRPNEEAIFIPFKEKDMTEISLKNGFYFPALTSGLFLSKSFLQNVMPLPEKHVYIDNILATLAPLFGTVKTLGKVTGKYRIHQNNYSQNKEKNLALICTQMYLLKEQLLNEKIRKFDKKAKILHTYYEYRTILFTSILYPSEFSLLRYHAIR